MNHVEKKKKKHVKKNESCKSSRMKISESGGGGGGITGDSLLCKNGMWQMNHVKNRIKQDDTWILGYGINK